jgi:hypothetical protein
VQPKPLNLDDFFGHDAFSGVGNAQQQTQQQQQEQPQK